MRHSLVKSAAGDQRDAVTLFGRSLRAFRERGVAETGVDEVMRRAVDYQRSKYLIPAPRAAEPTMLAAEA